MDSRHCSAAIGVVKNGSEEDTMTKLYMYAGIAASVVLIAFGIGSIYTGFDGRDRVRDDLAREQIVGTEDSTIPGQTVDTGGEAQAFAAVIRKHTLEATGGQTYAQMDRFLDANGNPTSDESQAAKDPKTGEPVENGLRNMWINSTALSTALNTAYFAESVATFAIVMGVAMLLTGIGFLVLTVRLLAPAAARAKAVRTGSPAVPTTS
jgi:F0F1-type ATP synthase membrane subunit c/vacuolar-type H+-ATPase subunit K